LALYRLSFSALIVIASVQTLLGAQADHAVLLLAGTEIAGALILCWRPAQWLGAGLLLIVTMDRTLMRPARS
jgi:NADH:ubiquinone oxidoreductase subunit 6 (subunit J)